MCCHGAELCGGSESLDSVSNRRHGCNECACAFIPLAYKLGFGLDSVFSVAVTLRFRLAINTNLHSQHRSSTPFQLWMTLRVILSSLMLGMCPHDLRLKPRNNPRCYSLIALLAAPCVDCINFHDDSSSRHSPPIFTTIVLHVNPSPFSFRFVS